MFDTKYKVDRWGVVHIAEAFVDTDADRIFAKVVVHRQTQKEDAIQASMRAEARKVAEETVRKAGEEEESFNSEACLRKEVARKAVAKAIQKAGAKAKNQVMACFSSVAELLKDMHKQGGRDPFVADLAKKHGPSTYKDGDTDGVIYMIICRIDLKIYVGQTTNVGRRIRSHFSERSSSECLTSAMNHHGRHNFVSVILLAGIKQQKELDSAKIALRETLITLVSGKPGYNIHPGGRSGIPGDMIRHHYSAVVITIQVTGEELYFDSFDEAAKEMGSQFHEIGGLANKMCKWKGRRCKGGE